MVTIACFYVRVLLLCCTRGTWRGESPGSPCCEVGENQLTNSKKYLLLAS